MHITNEVQKRASGQLQLQLMLNGDNYLYPSNENELRLKRLNFENR